MNTKAEGGRRKAEGSRTGTVVERIKAALARGPAVARVLAERLGMDYPRAQSHLGLAHMHGAVVKIGTFGDAVHCPELAPMVRQAQLMLRRGMSASAAVYALPGTAPLPGAPSGMNPSRAQLAQASRRRGLRGEAGAGEQVRQALEAEPGLTAVEVASRTGLDFMVVRRALTGMLKQGGVRTCGPRCARQYFTDGWTQPRVPVDAERPFRYAQPITIGRGSNWAAGL